MRRVLEAAWVALLPCVVAGCADSGRQVSDRHAASAPAGASRGGESGASAIWEIEAGGAGGGVLSLGGGGAAGAPIASERALFPGPPGAPDTTAVALDDPGIVAWATGVEALVVGAGSTDEAYHVKAKALGPATGATTDVLVLGDAGNATLTFDVVITDGNGFDLAVFENAVTDTFLELAYVEVSSDGATFARFPSTYLGTEPVPSFGAHDPRDIDGLAGKYPVGYGVPFDLASLASDPEVEAGRVDLDRITHVRIVDIVGDGSSVDSRGEPIYDPYPTVTTAGFDLDAVAVLNVAR